MLIVLPYARQNLMRSRDLALVSPRLDGGELARSWRSNWTYLTNYGCSDEQPTRCVVTLGGDRNPYDFNVNWWFRKAGEPSGQREAEDLFVCNPTNLRWLFLDGNAEVIQTHYSLMLVGGLVLHGAGDSGVGAPSFSVRIGDSSKAGWEIHT